MMIGTFNHEVTKYIGYIHTLTFNGPAKIEPASKRGENSPDYRVTDGDGYDIGVAWNETSEAANHYLSVRLDDPSFPAPVYCRLCDTAEGLRLFWNRPTKRRDAQ